MSVATSFRTHDHRVPQLLCETQQCGWASRSTREASARGLRMKLSVVVPAHNEEKNLEPTLTELMDVLDAQAIPFEIIVVDDNSSDGTRSLAEELATKRGEIRVLSRAHLPGFGRAIRAGLGAASGDVVVIVMADRSDDPRDVVRYYRKIEEGYDCVFGSRFRKGSSVENYPPVKLLANRLVNKAIQILFWTRFNDLTNAFKGFRREVLAACGPFSSSHFNITIELSLSALIRGYNIAEIPISWYGRTWGSSKLRLREMGRRYLSVILRMFFEKLLVADDILAERLLEQTLAVDNLRRLERRVDEIEGVLETLRETHRPDAE
jgi:dolichol-phosphate mannosyltransferase